MLISVLSVILCIAFYPTPGTAIVGGHEAQAPPQDDPVVFVNRRGKSARILGTRDAKRYSFKGLRYAQPPIGPLRFQRPQMYTLDGDITATKYGPPCPQPKPGTRGNSSTTIIGNEDCLFLNVFTPELPDGSDGLPVAVFIHGGGFRVGASSQYDAKYLTQKKLVMVTMQYRLGSLGFLSTGNGEQPGNAGMFDIALALRWVRDYITFFGGNPRQVIVMGQGTGGSVAVLIGMSDMTKGYAQGVVAMSGTGVSHWTMDKEPERTARSLNAAKTCPDSTHVKMVKCLQEKSPDEIIQSDSDIEEERSYDENAAKAMTGLQASGPVSEGEYDHRGLPTFVPRDPMESMKSGKFNKIPILTGVTKDETATAVHSNKRLNMRQKLTQNVDYLQKEMLGNLQSFTNVLQNGFLGITGITNDIQQNVGNALNTLPGGDYLGSPAGFLKRNKRQAQLANILSKVSPLQFDNYLKVADPKNINEALNKAVEVTGDALFNFPAFLTANLWSKTNTTTYLYSFEHSGNAPKAHRFLNSGPLVRTDEDSASNGKSKLVSHGDDLAYLFDPQTIDGEPIEDSDKLTAEDKKVRDIFTDMVSEFAHGVGHSKNPSRHRRAVTQSYLTPFNEKDNNYITITADPKEKKGFRFCEMALWGGLSERLQSTSCKFLSVVQNTVMGVQNKVKDTLPIGGGAFGGGGLGGGGFGGVLGGGALQSGRNKKPRQSSAFSNDPTVYDEQPRAPMRTYQGYGGNQGLGGNVGFRAIRRQNQKSNF